MRFLSEAESRTLLDACEGERLSALFHVLLGSGARIGEVLALTWGDVVEETGRLHITKSLVQRRGGLTVEEPKTSAGVRQVPVPQGVMDALTAHRRAMNEESLRRRENWTADDSPVFVTEVGTHISTSNFNKRTFKAVLERAGIRGRLRVHDLRHSYASHALSNGASLAAVSRALGHTRISTTLDRYTHALKSDLEQLPAIVGAVYG